METTAIPGAMLASSPGAATNRATDLSSQDFFKLLIAELQSQDPLKPKDTGQIVQQVANIRQLDLSNRLDKTLSGLAQQDRLAGVTNLIGKVVHGVVRSSPDAAPHDVDGVVIGLHFDDAGEPVLELDSGDVLPLAAVTAVKSQPSDASAATALKSLFGKQAPARGLGVRGSYSS